MFCPDHLRLRLLPYVVWPLAFFSMTARAQMPLVEVKAPPLEVISVKQNKDATENGSFGARPDGIFAQNVPLRFLLTLAFQRQFGKDQMVGVPEWADSDHFDIAAKVGEADIPRLHGLSGGPLTAMRSELLQSVLRERFQLKTHFEEREGPIYALVLAKAGPKIKPSPEHERDLPAPNGPLKPGSSLAIHGEIAGNDVPFSRFVEGLLSDGQLDRVVIDRTGLMGNYDFVLTWKPEQSLPASDEPSASETTLPSLFTAIQEQLGLKLEPTRGLVRTLVIDRLEKPSAN